MFTSHIVESLGLAAFEEKDEAALLAFQREAGEPQRDMMGTGEAVADASRRLQYIKRALLDTPLTDPRMLKTVRTLEKRLLELRSKLFGDWTVGRRPEPVSPSPMQRVSAQLTTTASITATTRRNYDIAADEFSTLLDDLCQVIEVDLRRLEEEMELAGAPWTPGRALPKWKKR